MDGAVHLFDAIRPWFLAGFFTLFAIRLILKEPRTFTMGEGVGREDVAWPYWLTTIFVSLVAIFAWIDVIGPLKAGG